MIFTFYSYKGGVGRSMALANMAELFYQAGSKVLVVDWDLEAPGIERFFPIDAEKVQSKPGILDLILGYKKQMTKEWELSDSDDDLPFDDPRKFLIEIRSQQLGPGKLWLLTSGKRDGDSFSSYAYAIRNFNWQDFYENWEGESYFEWLRQKFNEIADVVLIDSRTGVTEMGGVCVYQFSDFVVMFCPPNQQSLDGTYKMALDFLRPEVQDSRGGRTLELIVVPSRVADSAEEEKRRKFMFEFRTKFDGFIPKEVKSEIKSFYELHIPDLPSYAFDEAIAVGNNVDNAITKAFYKLSQVIAKLSPAQINFDILKKLESIGSWNTALYYMHAAEWDLAIKYFEELVEQAPTDDMKESWHALLETCKIEKRLSDSFEAAKRAIAHRNWLEARKSLERVREERPGYSKSGQSVEDLLKQIKEDNIMQVNRGWIISFALVLSILILILIPLVAANLHLEMVENVPIPAANLSPSPTYAVPSTNTPFISHTIVPVIASSKTSTITPTSEIVLTIPPNLHVRSWHYDNTCNPKDKYDPTIKITGVDIVGASPPYKIIFSQYNKEITTRVSEFVGYVEFANPVVVDKGYPVHVVIPFIAEDAEFEWSDDLYYPKDLQCLEY
jgi:MinD-like ATPase involved in chromosome partitioning or flagellar assembly